MYPPPPPAINPAELRPGRHWYVVAIAIAVLCILGGAGGCAYGLFTGIGKVRQTFSAGTPAVVPLTPGQQSAIYAGGRDGPIGTLCTVISPTGQQVAVNRPGYTFTTTTGGRTWRLLYTFNVTAAGDYRVSCLSNADTAGTYGVGDAPKTGRFVTGIVSAVALPLTGVFVGGLIVVVVSVRRRNHRRRLLAERLPPPTY